MAVLVGHASINEKGTVSGGVIGDQNEKEVCIRGWWDKGWNVVLRPNAEYADALAKACEAGCRNNNIGYSQTKRNTLHDVALASNYDLSTVGACDCDCSSFMTVCAIAAGITALEYKGNAPTTRTMKAIFKATNKFAVLTNEKYLRSDSYLKRGDILLKEGSHTAMVLTNGANVEDENAPADLLGKDIRKVSAVNLNARVKPMGTKLFLLSAGDMVNVVQEKDGWCKVEAWVSKNYLIK